MQVHYERFRFDKLREMMYPGGPRDYRVSRNIVYYKTIVQTMKEFSDFKSKYCKKSDK